MTERKKATINITRDRLEDLIHLSEEADLSVIVSKALTLYLTLLKRQAEGYNIILVSMQDDRKMLGIDLADL